MQDGGEWQRFVRTHFNYIYPPTHEPVDLAYTRLRIGDLLLSEGLRRRQRECPPTMIPSPGIVSSSANSDGLIHGNPDDTGSRILSATSRRRLFITDTGYMGLAHRSSLIGDKIYVLMGGDMPFAMRQISGTKFAFQGESYVHGLMDGEMLALARAKKDSNYRDLKDLAWLDDLAGPPYPFDVEKLVLV